MASVIAFDFGLKRVGVAIGNTLTGTAASHITLTVKNHKPDWKKIESLINEWKPECLVVGLPIEPNGSDSPLKPHIIRFSHQLHGRFHLPVETEDEQFTSIEASERLRTLRQSGRKSKVRKEEVDKLAAAVILENWLFRKGYSHL